jgi:hypothetical protein
MDIELLEKKFQRIDPKDLDMIPKPGIEGILNCNYLEFFNLNLLEIGNLYRADNKSIKFRHESNLVISKTKGTLLKKLVFDAKFEDEFFFENGVNYLGKIIIEKLERPTIALRVFGEGSYDPASTDPYLSKLDYSIISGFFVTALYSCRRGAEKDFIDTIFKVCMKNPSCITHNRLVEYLKYQIEKGIFDSQDPVDYSTYLGQHYETTEKDLLRKENEDYLTFLHLLKSSNKTKILPCKKYFDALEKNRGNKQGVIKYAKENPDVYIIPPPTLIERLYRENFIDMRILEQNAKEYENLYAEKIRKALENRPEITNSNMEELTKSYHSCVVY